MSGRPNDPAAAERALVDRARKDPDAFAELYRTHVDSVYRFILRRTGNVAVAEDLTASTFEKALAGLGRFRWRPPGIAPWFFRIAANLVADHHRRAGRRSGDRARRAADRLHAVVDPGEQDAIDDADEAQVVRAALDRLNPRYRRALALRYLADLDHDEAARSMGLAKPVFAVLVHRAAAALRRELGDSFELPSEWSPRSIEGGEAT